MREIQIDTLCDACSKCDLFELTSKTKWEDGKAVSTEYYCIHVNLCRNALKIMEKEYESTNRG